jgi:L-threonylcarbamoyladenylate synthase
MSTGTITTQPEQAAAWLRAGRCVGIPTETVYGLAANALDTDAVVQIFEIKNRPSFDPLIVHVAHLEQAERFITDFPTPLRRLAEHFWPGPLTLLLPRRLDLIPDLVTSGLERVGVRVPAHPVTLDLLRQIEFPVAAPSANPFGYISPTTAQHVMDQLGHLIPGVLDGGPCSVGVESTIIGMEGDQVVAYRLGGLPIEQAEQLVGPIQIQLNQSSNPAAPGMLASHYAPRKPLLMTYYDAQDPRLSGKKVGLLTLKYQPPLRADLTALTLSHDGDLAVAAQHLFAALRALDQSDVDIIVAEPVPNVGLGRAINDRLRRAAFSVEA